MPSLPHSPPLRRALTIVELLTVVVILGVLAAVAVPAFLNQRDSADDIAAISDVTNAYRLALAHRTLAGDYGSTASLTAVLASENPMVTTVANANANSGTAPAGTALGVNVYSDSQSAYFSRRSASGGVFWLRDQRGVVTRSWQPPPPLTNWPSTALSAGAGNTERAFGVATFDSGRSVVAGAFAGALSIPGAGVTTSAGADDALVASIGSDGSWQWAARAGGATGNDLAWGAAAGPNGATYITGRFWSSATFGSTTLVSAGGMDAFIARIDAQGNWEWAVRAGGIGDDRGYGVAVTDAGDLIVTGEYTGSATFGTTTLAGAGGQANIWVARLSATGSWEWARAAGGAGNDAGFAVATDGEAAIVGGWTRGASDFGAIALAGAGDDDGFVARISATGTWQWARAVAGADGDRIHGVAVYADGTSIATGYFTGTASVDGEFPLTSAGSSDVIVVQFAADGTPVWARAAGGVVSNQGYGVAVAADGSARVVGRSNGVSVFGSHTLPEQPGAWAGFVAAIDYEGTWQWARQSTGDDAQVMGVGIFADSTAVVAGFFSGTIAWGSQSLVGSGNDDIFVTRVLGDGATP